ncbi:MAG: hypothetical protein LBM75_06515 [Myxococcales bacterium]|jgi:hypothetical protein|nr:hypothetical protein [Myxococcales bacterium]
MLHKTLVTLMALVMGALLLVVPSQARANFFFAGELDRGAFQGKGDDFPNDWPEFPDDFGAKARFGYAFGDVFRLSLEGGGWYLRSNTGGRSDHMETYGGFAGARFSYVYGKILSPGIYAHIGYGEAATLPSEGRASYQHGPMLNLGASLDLVSIKYFVLGAHIEWNAMHLGARKDLTTDTLQWVNWGAHIGFGF